MSEHDSISTEEEREAKEKAIRMEYARKAGCLTREIAEMPDGGRAFLGEKTWQKLEDYAAERAKLPRQGRGKLR